jgi:hypothetical protein
VGKVELELISIACLWIAAKFEESSLLFAGDLEATLGVNAEHLVTTERRVLKTLTYKTNQSSVGKYLSLYTHILGDSEMAIAQDI